MSASAFRKALEDGDLKALRALWAIAAPHLPQDLTDDQAEIVMHRARTEAVSIKLKARAYSHRWLVERQLPSGLPDDLRPQAERLYPVIAEGVGIAVKANSPIFRSAAAEMEQAMSNAVADAYAEGRRDPAFVRSQMENARQRVAKALFG